MTRNEVEDSKATKCGIGPKPFGDSVARATASDKFDIFHHNFVLIFDII